MKINPREETAEEEDEELRPYPLRMCRLLTEKTRSLHHFPSKLGLRRFSTMRSASAEFQQRTKNKLGINSMKNKTREVGKGKK
ncbi:hypothetical protein AVEN_255875-1 [Araneus ventricosus]|uniref:Uncharacterized protein n=1 Tax=Araneus ventricosus TaxID=182803 RepID=A0A4Y2DDD0_ARAVE|nr:hypothetical protein AVEN_255875-1 [Araneus ventricosus]